jgi:ribonuclease-3
MSNSLPIEELEKTIKYSFKDKSIIKTALTHSSYANEQKARKVVCQCNERLEFLGDSVLS